jgi:hypothetical protein
MERQGRHFVVVQENCERDPNLIQTRISAMTAMTRDPVSSDSLAKKRLSARDV